MTTTVLYASPCCSCYCYYSSPKFMAKKRNSAPASSPNSKDSDLKAPRITTNVKQNLQFLKLWREYQKKKSNTPKPATSYRKKKVQKEEYLDDRELYHDPTMTLYYTSQGLETAVPVLLVDGYNVCGYWPKLKKHFMNGRLDVARQKLIDELITFSTLREVKVVAVFDAMMSGLPTHKETFASIDIVFSSETCADAWIEKEVVALREDGCPKVWVVTSDRCQQQAAYGAVQGIKSISWICTPRMAFTLPSIVPIDTGQELFMFLILSIYMELLRGRMFSHFGWFFLIYFSLICHFAAKLLCV